MVQHPGPLAIGERTLGEGGEHVRVGMIDGEWGGLQAAVGDHPPELCALPRLPHRGLPDADPGGPPAREAEVRAGVSTGSDPRGGLTL